MIAVVSELGWMPPMALDSAPMVWYRQEEIYSDEFAASILSAFKKLPRMSLGTQ
jgi:hypothetical protein